MLDGPEETVLMFPRDCDRRKEMEKKRRKEAHLHNGRRDDRSSPDCSRKWGSDRVYLLLVQAPLTTTIWRAAPEQGVATEI
jgi:hypothetical protein